MVLSDDSRGEFGLISFLREDARPALGVGSDGRSVEELLGECVFVVGFGWGLRRLCDLVAWQGALHI